MLWIPTTQLTSHYNKRAERVTCARNRLSKLSPEERVSTHATKFNCIINHHLRKNPLFRPSPFSPTFLWLGQKRN
ncbi:hypothetical protein EUGRSUZ_C00727 [Eucalyptus grandis]|uniref:Uncharacterized protein n=2 Tax=Eucalyptus grandis TaxID=71139 RepID=A0ACC3LB08_EUCGR|nr:hypothetical protein EUGRSUZ_C00727 [Eucalyptus grandis]